MQHSQTSTLEEALHQSEIRLSFALRTGSGGFWDWNVETGELYLTPCWLNMLGYAEDELEHDIQTLERLCHPDDLGDLRKMFDRGPEGDDADEFEIEHRVVAKSGEWRWILTRGVVGKRGESGEPVRIAATASDITDRREAREQLCEHRDLLDEMVAQRTLELAEANAQLQFDIAKRKEAEEELQQSNQRLVEGLDREKHISAQLKTAMEEAEASSRAKSEFLANMSHEIRTPMTAILGFTDVLIEHGNLDDAPPERIEAAKTIKRNGEHLITVINDILDLSRIEAGRVTVEQIACSPSEIVSEVASLMGPRAEAEGLSFGVEYIGAIPETILTDPTRLRQILINLVGNAVKFTEVGGVRLVIRLVDAGREPAMQFDVVDTGIGIAEGQVRELFQPFAQADTSMARRFGGTGLGLAISRRFAELLGGDVAVVETQANIGTRFRVTVATGPLNGVKMIDHRVSLPTAPTESEPATPHTDRADLHDLRILLAEDGPDNQRLISFILKKAGAEVTLAENGQLALDVALAAVDKAAPFDVILMDMQMPVMGGYEATELLRKKGYTGPIIALTAHAMEGDREKCINAGCDGYSTKPIDRVKLVAIILANLTTVST